MGRPSAISVTRRGYRIRRGAWIAAVTLLTIVFAFWFRDCSLVAVKHVKVDGVSGADAQRIRSALEAASGDMTTLHIRKDDLQAALEPFPSVKSIKVGRSFPNTLDITINQRTAVAAIVVGNSRQAVAADGVILRGSSAAGVPIVPATMPATGDRVTGRRALQALAVLGAAPAVMRPKIVRLKYTADGIVITLTKGPELRFGTAARPHAKWMALSRVLADDSSQGAIYIDVSLPERPAAGGLEDPATQQDPRTADDATPLPGTDTGATTDGTTGDASTQTPITGVTTTQQPANNINSQ